MEVEIVHSLFLRVELPCILGSVSRSLGLESTLILMGMYLKLKKVALYMAKNVITQTPVCGVLSNLKLFILLHTEC